MPWDHRASNSYYYRKRRLGKRVISEYIGAGLLAEMVAEQDAEDRERRQAERDALRQEAEAVEAYKKELDRKARAIRILTRAVLLDLGYHPHKGQMRRKRERE